MTPFLAWLSSSAVQLTLLVAIVSVIAFACRNCSAQLRYTLWLLVLAKVFVPPGLGAPWAIGNLLPTDTPAVTLLKVSAPFDDQPAVNLSPATEGEDATANPGTPAAFPQSLARESATGSQTQPPAYWQRVLSLTWLAGAVAYVLCIVVPYAVLINRLRRADQVDEGPLAITYQQLVIQVSPGRTPPVLVLSPDVSSPFLCGYFQPAIVLPASHPKDLTMDQLRYVLLHELTHWKRRDVLVGYAQALAQALFWFHPLVWFANGRIRFERENACDEAVLGKPVTEPRAYADTLLKVLLVARGRSSAVPGFLGIFERSTQLRERLEQIMTNEHRRKPNYWQYALVGLAAILLIPMSAGNTAKAQGSAKDESTTLTVRTFSLKAADNVTTSVDAQRTEAQDVVALMKRMLYRESTEHIAAQIGRRYFYDPNTLNLTIVDTPDKMSIAANYLRSLPWLDQEQFGSEAPATDQEPDIALLNEVQRAWFDWTKRQFGNPDSSRFAQTQESEKKQLEDRWITILEGPENSELHGAINGLAALGSKRAIEPLKRIATERRDKNNRGRWMAIRALAALNAKEVVPDLVHLVYHPNQNTRMWAQIALVRLTGQNFGYDWEKWAEYWNGQGGHVSVEKLNWIEKPEDQKFMELAVQQEADQKFLREWKERNSGGATSASTMPKDTAPPTTATPQIVSIMPAVGSRNVDAATTAIVVVFDRDMDTNGYSWIQTSKDYPPDPGKQTFWQDKRTIVKPVKLEAGKFYGIGMNSDSHQNFRSAEGVPVPPTALYFSTTGAPEEEKSKAIKPQVTSMSPPNGTTGVDPKQSYLRVSFSVPMLPTYSWTGGGENFPTIPEGKKPSWSEDKKTCTLPVQLKPNHEYRLGLNSVSFRNFRSEAGVPLDPIIYTFATGAGAE